MKHEFRWNDEGFLMDGEPFRIFSGEMHYFRIPREYWRDRLKKARCIGLNTVCTYLCWNLHEPKPGEFLFDGMLDVAEYVRTAHQEGLWVIVRPGPYICSEWDFGGLPAWLLAEPDICVRCTDERYIEAAGRYIARVGQELASLQCTRDGPIIAVQVENEYGSYGNDKAYLAWLRDALRNAGFEVPLFTSDGPSDRNLRAGTLEDILAVVNFGEDPQGAYETLRRYRPTGPAMCGEFWDGWFDHWGTPHTIGETAKKAKDLEWMLANGMSFNLYMVHGGTNFGFMNGANYSGGYSPLVTSYDYDAPLDEAGRPTEKFFTFQRLLAKSQPAGTKLPELPPPTPIIEIPQIALTESVSLFDSLPKPIRSPQPRSIEMFGQSYGFILYRTRIAGMKDGDLRIHELRDYAHVFMNGKRQDILDRRLNQNKMWLSVPEYDAVLDILVENMGRVNYGPDMLDRKGITDRVSLDDLVLMNWEILPLPMDDLSKLKFKKTEVPAPAFHRGSFTVGEVGDTFLDMRDWRKGVVWINCHNLGRYWNIGPQQTLYLPAPWLEKGQNEILVFELEKDGRRPVPGLANPILDQVRVSS